MPPDESPGKPGLSLSKPVPDWLAAVVAVVAFIPILVLRAHYSAWSVAGRGLVPAALMLAFMGGVWGVERRRGRPLPRRVVVPAFILATAAVWTLGDVLLRRPPAGWFPIVMGSALGATIGFNWSRRRSA